MKKIIGILVFVLILPISFRAEDIQKNQIVLKGVVTDVNTGKPVSCDLIIETPDNKKFKIFSDPINGNYTQLIQGGSDWKFTLYAYNVLRTEEIIKYPANDKYREEIKNFKVTQLNPGVTVFKKNLFAKNSDVLNPEIEDFIKEFKKILRFHRTVTWDVYVSVDDTYSKYDAKTSEALLKTRFDALTKSFNVFKANISKINIIANKDVNYAGTEIDVVFKVNKIEPAIENVINE